MGLIYGGIGWGKSIDPSGISILREELKRFPTDEFDELEQQKNLSGGLYSIRLRKAPFPQEKCIQDKISGIEIVADARLDYREDLFRKLGIDLEMLYQISDSQLILKAYKKWGRKCVHHLEGDFVFFLFDPKLGGLWGARDPIGMRPIFFIQNSSHCLFSSSIKGLVRLPEVKSKANSDFYRFKFFKIKCSPDTSHIEGIYQIPMGHEVTIDSKGFKINRYFEWERKIVKSNKNSAKELQELMRKAVETRLYTDYEIGCKFSGGIDSSAVAAFCCEYLKSKFSDKYLITASSVAHEENHERDERPWVDLFAKHYSNIKTNCLTFDLPPPFIPEHAELFNCLQFRRYTVFNMESKMNNHFIESGCKTALTGWRGDHYVSRHDYYAFIELLKTGKWLSFLLIIKKAAKWRKISIYVLIRKLVRYCRKSKGETKERYELFNTTWVAPFIEKAKEKCKSELKWELRDLEWDFKNLLPAFGNELKFYVEDKSFLLKKPLCTLHPLSDVRVIKYALSMPAIEFEREGMDRSLMRKALKGVIPEKIRLRRDKGLYMYEKEDIVRCNLMNWIDSLEKIEPSNSFSQFINIEEVKRYLNEILLDPSHKSNDIEKNRNISLNIMGFLVYFATINSESNKRTKC